MTGIDTGPLFQPMTTQRITFSDLPPHIRKRIWNYAIRRDRPGAHFFSVYNWEDIIQDFAGNKLEDVAMVRAFEWLTCYRPHFLKPPRKDECDTASTNNFIGPPVSGAPWSYCNRSTYLVDGGLWTACKESRACMLEAFCDKFPPPSWPRKIVDYPPSPPQSAPGSPLSEGSTSSQFIDITRLTRVRQPATFSIAPAVSSSAPWWCTVVRAADLVCFRPRSFATAGASWASLVVDAAFLAPRRGHVGADNLAVVLPRRRADDGGGAALLQDVARALAHLARFATRLWLVDELITRRADACVSDDEVVRAVFYGEGCRFVEVFDDDLDSRRRGETKLWRVHDTHPFRKAGMFNDFFEFPDGIGRLHADGTDIGSPSYEGHWRRVGMLAVEYGRF